MKESTLSFKDAAQAANDYMQAFNKMDWKQLQITFGMAGKGLVEIMQKSAKEMWGAPLKENEKKLADLTNQLEAAEKAGDKDKQGELKNSINNLEKEMKSANVRLSGFNKAVEDYQKSGAVGELQQYRDLLTGNLAQVMGQIEDNTDPGNYTAKLVALQKGLNIGPELLRAVEDAKSTIASNYNDLSKTFEGKLGDAIGGNEQQIEYTKKLVEYGKANSSSPEKLSDLKDAFRKQGQDSKMSDLESEKYAKNMIDMISSGDLSSDDIISALDALKKGNDTISKQESTKFLKPGKIKTRQLVDESMKAKKVDEEGYDTLNDNELEMIKSTTSAADYLDIAKDSLKYMAADKLDQSGIMKEMLKGVLGIGGDVSLLASDKRDKMEGAKGAESKTTYAMGGYGDTPYQKISAATAGVEKLKADAELKDLNQKKDLSDKEKEKKDQLLKNIDQYNSILKSSIKNLMSNHLNATEAQRAQEELINNESINISEKAKKDNEYKSKVHKNIDLPTAPQAPGTVPETAKTPGPPPSVKDFKATQAGLALLDKGDIAFNPSIGIAGKSGAFVNEVLSKMGLFDAPMAKGAEGSNASYQINLGGIQVNGNIEDPVVVRQAGQKLTQMVEQVILKHEREKMLAKV